MSKKSRKIYVLDSARIFNVNYKVKPDLSDASKKYLNISQAYLFNFIKSTQDEFNFETLTHKEKVKFVSEFSQSAHYRKYPDGNNLDFFHSFYYNN